MTTTSVKTQAQVDEFMGGIRLERGVRVIMRWPYLQEGTYEYPSLGVSSLTNASVSTSQGMMQYPASLLEVRHDN